VKNTLYANGCNRGALNRRQQGPAKRVAQRKAKAPLERLDYELAAVYIHNFTLAGDFFRH
jgi:hypothetical protein